MRLVTTLALTTAFGAAIAVAQAGGQGTLQEWKQLVPCIKVEQGASQNCPVDTFDTVADDPADRARMWRRRIEPVDRFDLLEDQADLANAMRSIGSNGSVFKCLSSSDELRKCAAMRRMPSLQRKETDLSPPRAADVNFVYFYPPYSDHRTDGATKLSGTETYCSVIRGDRSTECESTGTSVDDYWMRWVDLSSADDSLKLRTAQSFRELIRPNKPCNADALRSAGYFLRLGECSAITLLVDHKDGLGVIADCGRRRVAQQLGPPIQESCGALVAFDDMHIWVPAYVMAAPHSVTGCLRDTIGNCALAMGFNFNFAEEEAGKQFIQTNKTLVTYVVEEFKKRLRQTPWNINDIAFDSNLSRYTGISTKRRSQIVDGYEDLSIYMSVSGAKRPDDPFHLDHSSDFQIRPGTGEARDLRIVMEIEIYVSRYNSPDNAYWIKPTSEQEASYRAALAKVFADSAAASCAVRQLKASQDDSTHAHCE